MNPLTPCFRMVASATALHFYLALYQPCSQQTFFIISMWWSSPCHACQYRLMNYLLQRINFIVGAVRDGKGSCLVRIHIPYTDVYDFNPWQDQNVLYNTGILFTVRPQNLFATFIYAWPLVGFSCLQLLAGYSLYFTSHYSLQTTELPNNNKNSAADYLSHTSKPHTITQTKVIFLKSLSPDCPCESGILNPWKHRR
jgi:hypothetical protein